jgi:hypothetical protein
MRWKRTWPWRFGGLVLAVQGQSVVMGRMAEELQVYDCYSACSVRHANKEESHPDQSHPILIRAIPS